MVFDRPINRVERLELTPIRLPESLSFSGVLSEDGTPVSLELLRTRNPLLSVFASGKRLRQHVLPLNKKQGTGYVRPVPRGRSLA
jgi:hypothetical protein